VLSRLHELGNSSSYFVLLYLGFIILSLHVTKQPTNDVHNGAMVASCL